MDDPFLFDDVIESQASLDQLLKGLVTRVVIGLDGPSATSWTCSRLPGSRFR